MVKTRMANPGAMVRIHSKRDTGMDCADNVSMALDVELMQHTWLDALLMPAGRDQHENDQENRTFCSRPLVLRTMINRLRFVIRLL